MKEEPKISYELKVTETTASLVECLKALDCFRKNWLIYVSGKRGILEQSIQANIDNGISPDYEKRMAEILNGLNDGILSDIIDLEERINTELTDQIERNLVKNDSYFV